jgi:hypothetical protein
MADAEEAKNRDFRDGVFVRDLADGGIALGQAGGEDVVLVRRGVELFAVDANCTPYHGMLSQGLVVGDTLRCPGCLPRRAQGEQNLPAVLPAVGFYLL